MANFFNIDPRLFEEIQDSLRRFAELLKILPGYLKKLADYGWFISLDMEPREIQLICDKLTQGKMRSIDLQLSKRLELELPRIKKNLINKYPHRKKILQSAFKAHNNKNYYLSIPVLLTQIDGICIEELGVYFFSTKNKKPKTKEIIDSYEIGYILNSFLEPMKVTTAISQSIKDKQYHTSFYNRHEILHGIETEYGTKLNSCKVISLLSYIVEMIENLKE